MTRLRVAACVVALALALGWAVAQPAYATPITFTDSASFMAALTGPATTLDFDALAAGTLVPSGASVDGITFVYDFSGIQLLISDAFDTSSPPNFLGTDDGDVLQDGDDFDLSFAAKNAIGISFITADALFDGDISLSAGGATASLLASAVEQTLPDGSDVYFLGIVDPTGTFTGAQVATIGGGFFLYNVDDIVTAAPEPGAGALVLVGLLGLAVQRRASGRAAR